MFCDLHTHTNFSDGSFTPAELVQLAKEKNLIIALTDHNTSSGLPIFMKEAEAAGVTAVAGVELSTNYQEKEFHLLGLFLEPQHYEAVESLCVEYQILKEFSNLELVEKLNNLGYHIEYPNVRRRNVKGNANRAHVAEELVACGYVGSVTEAFRTLLDEDLGIYVPPRRLDLIEAIGFLRGIDAVPVLAHPVKDVSADKLREMLPALIDAGLMGIETMHSSFDNDTIAMMKEMAKEFGLTESGGSDFHGSAKPDVMLGTGKGNLCIDEQVYLGLLSLKNKGTKQ